jgi:hypothetical protein
MGNPLPFSLSLGHRRARRQDWRRSARETRVSLQHAMGRARPSRPAPKIQSHRARVALRNSRRSRASEIPCRYGSKSTRMDAACQRQHVARAQELAALARGSHPIVYKTQPTSPRARAKSLRRSEIACAHARLSTCWSALSSLSTSWSVPRADRRLSRRC